MAPANRGRGEGLVVGLIAYASVAVFYGVFDVFAARGPLYTVDLLGKAVFKGLRDAAVLQYPIQPDFTGIFWYNALHLVLSLLIGLVVVALVDAVERRPERRGAVLLVIVLGFVVTILGVGFLTEPMRPLLPWWSIVVANALATTMAGAFLLRRRPRLWGRLVPIPG